ncbi:MAG: SAM-dependent methyltransferase [Bacteroidota bacterium]|nr:SAM-dependent methyltransferase [Bacteroidota bacterium]
MNGKLYLIPNLLGEGRPEEVLPPNVLTIIRSLRYFIVEDVRTVRRFLAKTGLPHPIDSLTFYTLNEHTTPAEITHYLDPIKDSDIGIVSEAGVPGVADPGADIVRLAHQKGIQVVPLVGPSSILMAVMASGMNGQSFAFNGYLPVKNPERSQKIKFFEKRALAEGQTQLFIETPYRNNHLLGDILSVCAPTTMIGIAADISLPTEFIRTMSASAWKTQIPELHKRPAIFMIGR